MNKHVESFNSISGGGRSGSAVRIAAILDLQGLPRVQNGKPDMGAYEGVVLPAGMVLMIR